MQSHVSTGRRIHGTGEMADLIRAKDWSQTPLGPIESWSEVLVASLNLALLSPFSFALYWGEELTLLYNDVYRGFLGGKHPEALGSPGPRVWEEAWAVIGPPIHAALSEGTGLSASESFIPVLIDGEMQDRWWSYGFHPLYVGDEIVGVANPGSDDTAKMLARKALQENEARTEQILSATQDAVVMIDRAWRFTYLNPRAEALYGSARNLVGKNVWEMFPKAIYEGSPFIEHYTRAMEDRVAGRFEVSYPEPLNFTIGLEVYPTQDGIVTFSRDVTEVKRATAAALQNEKLAVVGRLASSIAHEINNPLESVTNLLYLARTSPDLETVSQYLDIAERELRRVSIISNQTLQFHKQSTNPTFATCQDLFASSLSIYQGRLLNSRVEVKKRKRATEPAECFEGEIRQVLTNLISNAIDAMHPAGGDLTLRSRHATCWTTGKKGLMLTVADTGTGMSSQVQSRIFEAFYTTKGIGGTGLGLWVSKEIMDRHGGMLRVRSSQKEGASGTVFNLFLPFEPALRKS